MKIKWHELLCSSGLATGVVSTAFAQSVNVDFGTGAGVPPADYAAAGVPGTWNGLDLFSASGGPIDAALVGLDGEPAGVVLNVAPVTDTFTVGDPATTGNDEALFDDVLDGLGDVTVTLVLAGLESGTYDVIAYAWAPSAPAQGSIIFFDDDFKNGQIVGGAWPDGLQLGVTHARHTVEVTDGTMNVSMVASFWGTTGVFNGIQLRLVEEIPEDLNGDGVVNTLDLLILIGNWTTPGHGCDGLTECSGDVNGDGVVNIVDLVMLLAAWQ